MGCRWEVMCLPTAGYPSMIKNSALRWGLGQLAASRGEAVGATKNAELGFLVPFLCWQTLWAGRREGRRGGRGEMTDRNGVFWTMKGRAGHTHHPPSWWPKTLQLRRQLTDPWTRTHRRDMPDHYAIITFLWLLSQKKTKATDLCLLQMSRSTSTRPNGL